MHTALAICPHADDAAAFFGGTLIKLAASGWKIVLVRVTDDCKDSVGMTREETTRLNTEQFEAAARILGAREIIELGYETDCLADASEVALRERFVYLFRKFRPYAVFTFDPFGLYEGNMDHIAVAQAVEEAFWVSCFDLHYPEHFAEGLSVFAVCERWYYGRNLPGANHVEDVTDQFEESVDALCAHDIMMRNLVNQLRLQSETWGRRVPLLDEAFAGDLRPLIRQFLHGRAAATAKHFQLADGRLAESFRLSRFGGFEALFQSQGVRIPGAPTTPVRPEFGESDSSL